MIEYSCADEMLYDPDFSPERCIRYWDDHPADPGWQCVNDHTGCFWNDGHNTCFYEGSSLHPLEEEDEG